MKFSVLTAVYNPVAEHLRACMASVAAQRGDVEHVLVDDGSSAPEIRAALESADPHAVVRFRSDNGGIVAASNDAIASATGDWFVLLDHDDLLAADAIATLAVAIDRHPDADVIYSDHALVRTDGRIIDPAFKPDFSPERLRHTNYITHLLAIRADAVRSVGGFTVGSDGAQDHDLLLKLLDGGFGFHHVPEILGLWRQAPASVASNPLNKPAAFERGIEAIQRHLNRCGVEATVAHGDYLGTYQIERQTTDGPVSVVIPTNGSYGTAWGIERCFVVDAVRSLAANSTDGLEFVIVTDAETPTEVRRRLAAIDADVHIVEYPATFNFSDKINVGVEAARHDLLLILNDDTEAIEPDSVARMAALLQTQDLMAQRYGPVGIVGARLLYPDGTLQHAGHLYHGEFMHACIGWDGDHPGPWRMLHTTRECAGVTAAAMMTTREVFEAVGGFAVDLPLHFNDVDFSLNVRAAGYRILYEPGASWYHFEGRTRTRGATMQEWTRAASHWPDGVPHDPYANPNLVPKQSDWLELPGRRGAPPFYLDDTGHRRFA